MKTFNVLFVVSALVSTIGTTTTAHAEDLGGETCQVYQTASGKYIEKGLAFLEQKAEEDGISSIGSVYSSLLDIRVDQAFQGAAVRVIAKSMDGQTVYIELKQGCTSDQPIRIVKATLRSSRK